MIVFPESEGHIITTIMGTMLPFLKTSRNFHLNKSQIDSEDADGRAIGEAMNIKSNLHAIISQI